MKKLIYLFGMLLLAGPALAGNTISQIGCVLSNAPSVHESKVTVSLKFKQAFDIAAGNRLQGLYADLIIHINTSSNYSVKRSNVYCTRDFPFYASRLTCSWVVAKKLEVSSLTLIPDFNKGAFTGRLEGDLRDTQFPDAQVGDKVLDTKDVAYVAADSLVCSAK